MKKYLYPLLFLCFQITHAFRGTENIKINTKNCSSLGFVISITENTTKKDFYNIDVLTPLKGKKGSVIGGDAVLRIERIKKTVFDKAKSSQSLIRVNNVIKQRNDYNEVSVTINKKDINNTTISMFYYVPAKEGEKTTWDSESFYYKINLRDFKPKK